MRLLLAAALILAGPLTVLCALGPASWQWPLAAVGLTITASGAALATNESTKE